MITRGPFFNRPPGFVRIVRFRTVGTQVPKAPDFSRMKFVRAFYFLFGRGEGGVWEGFFFQSVWGLRLQSVAKPRKKRMEWSVQNLRGKGVVRRHSWAYYKTVQSLRFHLHVHSHEHTHIHAHRSMTKNNKGAPDRSRCCARARLKTQTRKYETRIIKVHGTKNGRYAIKK